MTLKNQVGVIMYTCKGENFTPKWRGSSIISLGFWEFQKGAALQAVLEADREMTDC